MNTQPPGYDKKDKRKKMGTKIYSKREKFVKLYKTRFYEQKQIAEMLNVCENTITRWKKIFFKDEIKQQKGKGNTE